MLQETNDIQAMRARMRRIRANRATRWHAVRVMPNTEFKVRTALDKLDVATVLPTVERWVLRPFQAKASKHKVRRDCPLFEGYIFVGFANAPNWRDVTSIEPGPVVPVGHSGCVWALSASDLAYLHALESGAVSPINAFKVGSKATVGDGHWAAGQSGRIEGLKCDIAQISLQFLGSLHAVPVHVSMLSAA